MRENLKRFSALSIISGEVPRIRTCRGTTHFMVHNAKMNEVIMRLAFSVDMYTSLFSLTHPLNCITVAFNFGICNNTK